ncbi:MAG: glyoxalase [Alteromonadaceae bacterium]|nr:MAG: glyoxalase [Alteromonadaceae bacterium]
MKDLLESGAKIDHIAIAVKDLDEALVLYENVFGFELLRQREIKGEYSGMKSAELRAGAFSIVLVQGTDPGSQVTRFIENYGPGVQHVAIEVSDVEKHREKLAATGVKFATDIIEGENLVQLFTRRDDNSGVMFEFIERRANKNGFEADNIQQLFEQLERSDSY